MNDELSNDELIENFEVSNTVVLQQVMLKLIKHNIKSEIVCKKFIEYSKFMDIRFKILGPCKLGHLAIYSLKKLDYNEEYKDIYEVLEDEDKELVDMIEKAL